MLRQTVQLLLVGGLLYILARRGLLSWQQTRDALSEFSLILPAALLFVGVQLVVCLRWQLLLTVHGLRLSYWRAFELVMVGNFFNLALPGAVSGDVVKGWLAASESGQPKSTAYGTVVFDRILGMTGLVVVALAGALLTGGSEPGSRFVPVRFMALGVGGVMFIGYAWLLLIPDNRDPVLGVLRSLAGRSRMVEPLQRMYESLRYFRAHRGLLLGTVALSTFGFTLTSSACALLVWALGETHLQLVAVLSTAPLGLLVSAIPIAPAGVGTGHAAFTVLFASLGSDRGADLYTLYLLYLLCQGAVGGLVYLRLRGRSGTGRAK